MDPRLNPYAPGAGQRPPELVETDVPAVGRGQVLVQIAGNGLCHSDMTMMQMPAEVAQIIDWRVPFTLGHEIGGRRHYY